MNGAIGALCATIFIAGSAAAAPILSDNFNDGSFNNQPPSSTNPTWQVLLLPGFNTDPTANQSDADRWSVSSQSPIEPPASLLWSDQPCYEHYPATVAAFGGDVCFPVGAVYTDPAPNRPGQVGTYTIKFTARLERTTPRFPIAAGPGNNFTHAAAPAILLFPPDQSGLAGGYAAGLVLNAGANLDDPSDDTIAVGIIYIEGNVQSLYLKVSVLLARLGNIDPSTFFTQDHAVEMTVRSNRYIELVIDGEFYGTADTNQEFVDAADDPADGCTNGNHLDTTTNECKFTPLVEPEDTQQLAIAGLADNINRYDQVEYTRDVRRDADGNGVPDGFEGAPDFDCDGIRNDADPDGDNDGTPDYLDPPTSLDDLDGDGSPDQCDADADGDDCADAQDADPRNVTPPDCTGICGAPAQNPDNPFDCDGDGVADDCETKCGTLTCDPASFCDVTPPSIVFVEPIRDSVYVQDSMSSYAVLGVGSTTASSITIKASVRDEPGSGVATVGFFVRSLPDGAFTAVPAEEVNAPEPPIHSFKYRLDGSQSGNHDIKAVATDRRGNVAEKVTRLRVIDASVLTDDIATDVTDQYAVMFQPGAAALSGSAYYAIRPAGGYYTIKYWIVEYNTLADTRTARVVQGCRPNVLYVVDFDGTKAALTTPGAPLPGFWHDDRYTVTRDGVDCSRPNTATTGFVKGVYTVRIPASELAAQANQPVGMWAYVDVPDRASTNGPTGPVDSASGFFNVWKFFVEDNGLADRLDEEPTPIFIRP